MCPTLSFSVQSHVDRSSLDHLRAQTCKGNAPSDSQLKAKTMCQAAHGDGSRRSHRGSTAVVGDLFSQVICCNRILPALRTTQQCTARANATASWGCPWRALCSTSSCSTTRPRHDGAIRTTSTTTGSTSPGTGRWQRPGQQCESSPVSKRGYGGRQPGATPHRRHLR